MVTTHYIGTFDDGVEFDNSYTRGEPIEFVLGRQMMIPGFDRAVQGMEVGEKIEVHLEAEDAYGPYREELVQALELALIPGGDAMEVGQYVVFNENKVNYRCLVSKIEDGMVTLDQNHPLAGKPLNFSIELVSEKLIPAPGQTTV
jgi:FKBP-type peptidyl-prolyl cis-trans isomerase 2